MTTPSRPFGRRLHVIVLREGREAWSGSFDQADVLVGRSGRSDVVLDDAGVSWTHALIRHDPHDGIAVIDHSSNGSFYEGRRLATARLGEWGVIAIPPFEIDLRLEGDPAGPLVAAGVLPDIVELRFVVGPPALVGTTVPLAAKLNTIGRAPDCDVRLDMRSVSRYHATLRPAGHGRWRVQDAGSQNGLELNAKAVRDADVAFGDRIGFGAEIVAVLQKVPASHTTVPAPSDIEPATVASDRFTISVAASGRHPDVTLFHVTGRIDRERVPMLRARLAQAIEDGRLLLVVDLTSCLRCDDAGIGVILHAQARLRQRGGALYLAGPSPELQEAMHRLRLEHVLSCVADAESAALELDERATRR